MAFVVAEALYKIGHAVGCAGWGGMREVERCLSMAGGMNALWRGRGCEVREP